LAEDGQREKADFAATEASLIAQIHEVVPENTAENAMMLYRVVKAKEV
jgi:hypothetical protein